MTKFGAPLLAGVKANIQCWPIAVDKVRYVGEPVAVVVAADRYLAEDALELIEVDYAPLPITLRPADALNPESAMLHEGLGGNIASDRSFRYGDPEAAFAAAAHRVAVKVDYPRNSCTPIETYGLIADYDPGEDAYDVLATFQGPFSIHAGAVARAESAGQPAAAAHAARLGRQLRREAGYLPLYCPNGDRRARRGPAGEMDRGQA